MSTLAPRELTAQLPQSLRGIWSDLLTLEEQLTECLNGEDIEQLGALAAARHQSMVHFFDQFAATAENAILRIELLHALLANNQRLQAMSGSQLHAVVTTSESARHNKRAVAAYRSQDQA